MRKFSSKTCEEKKKKSILTSMLFFRKSFHLRDNVEKYGGAREAAGGTHARCMLDK
jgi:hypothetical protein